MNYQAIDQLNIKQLKFFKYIISGLWTVDRRFLFPVPCNQKIFLPCRLKFDHSDLSGQSWSEIVPGQDFFVSQKVRSY